MADSMQQALEQAKAAGSRGEVPVGAVVTDGKGEIIAAAGNAVEAGRDASAHAEMLVLRQAAAKLGAKFLADCTLTVTLEPCAMCAGAISQFRPARLVFGAYDPKSGGVEHGPRIFAQPTTHHRPEIIGGVRETECAALLKEFFAGLRDA